MSSQTNKEETHNYFFGLKPDEGIVKSHASRSVENQCQYMLPILQRMVAGKPDLKLFDVGCGPGSITTSLARYMPSDQLVGVDVSEAVLEKARQAVKDEGVENVEFQTADAYELPLEGEIFDVIHTHQAVCHFHDHVRTIKEMLRVLRFWPERPLLDKCNRSIITIHKRKDGAADAGRQLKAWTVQAGVPREKLMATAGTWCYNTPEKRRDFHGTRMFKRQTGEKAVELGVLNRKRIEEYEEAWKQWTDDKDGMLMLMHGQVIATK